MESGKQTSSIGISRQQVLVWSATALAVLLIGGNYLRGHLNHSGPVTASVTVAERAGSTDSVKREPVLIKIHIAGAVSVPGLYQMEQDSRVADAISRAGGTIDGADLDRVNLAAKLVDGEQIVVPMVGEALSQVAAGANRVGVTDGPEAKININTGSAEELQQLDGVGPKTAEKIIAYREQHGGFKSIEELMDVPGIGPSKFETMKEQVTL